MIVDAKPKSLGLPTDGYYAVEEVHDVSPARGRGSVSSPARGRGSVSFPVTVVISTPTPSRMARPPLRPSSM